MRDDEVTDDGEEEAVDFFSADDVNLLINEGKFIEFFGVVDAFDTIVVPSWVTGDDDVLAVREGLADGVKGLAAHDNRVS